MSVESLTYFAVASRLLCRCLCRISFNTDGESVTVVDVSLGPPDVKVDDDTAYAGPVRKQMPQESLISCGSSIRLESKDAYYMMGTWSLPAQGPRMWCKPSVATLQSSCSF